MFNLAHFLKTRPVNYARQNYDAFLAEVDEIKFKKSIHIAGTNGKGSTATYLFEIFRAAGYKTALYISPHFKTHNELARVNDELISDVFIEKTILEYLSLIEKHKLSFFEVMTFVSFKYFESEKVDIAVIETGLGGLIDATNIFTPTLSIITNIHTDHLVEIGPDITDITRHKAGIIKRHVPVILGVKNEELLKIISEVAREKQSPIIIKKEATNQEFKALDNIKFTWNEKTYEINTGAIYETYNAAIVLEAINYLIEKGFVVIKREHIDQAFKKGKLRGRFTVAQKNPLLIIDGAHNMNGIEALMASVVALKKSYVKVIYAAFHDKEILQIFDFFKKLELDVTLTTFEHERSAKSFPFSKYPFIEDYHVAISEAVKKNPKGVIVICGSLYFANLVLEDY